MTPQKREICKLMADPNMQSHSVKAIAFKMRLAEGTVKRYLSEIYKETGLDRAGVVLLGAKFLKYAEMKSPYQLSLLDLE